MAQGQRCSFGGKRGRWLVWVSLGLTAGVLGLWGRSEMIWDVVRVSLPARAVLEVQSCGGVVEVSVQQFEKHFKEFDEGPVWSWNAEYAHAADEAYAAMQSVGIPVEYPWDRFAWGIVRSQVSTYPPRIPVGWSTLGVRLPHWLVAMVASVPLWLVLRDRLRQRVRGRRGRCPLCGYDLRGTLAAGGKACPECGEAVGEDTARKPLSERSGESS